MKTVKQELVAWDLIAAFYVEGVGLVDKNDVRIVVDQAKRETRTPQDDAHADFLWAMGKAAEAIDRANAAEARLEAARKIARREQRRSWVAPLILAALSVGPRPEPDEGGKVAVDEAGCECHRDQPKADVYACRYGGYHRRRGDGSLWHHPGDQAMVPAS